MKIYTKPSAEAISLLTFRNVAYGIYDSSDDTQWSRRKAAEEEELEEENSEKALGNSFWE